MPFTLKNGYRKLLDKMQLNHTQGFIRARKVFAVALYMIIVLSLLIFEVMGYINLYQYAKEEFIVTIVGAILTLILGLYLVGDCLQDLQIL